MATWVGYFSNALAELYNTGTSSVTGVADSGATGTAPYAVDMDLATQWLPGSSATRDFQINLGSAMAIDHVAILGHNVSTAVTLYSAATFGATTTSQVSFTPTSGVDTGGTVGTAGVGVSSRYWTLRITSPTASTYIGEIFLGLVSGRVDFSTAGPYMPLGRALSPGFATVQSANGSIQTQVTGGPSRVLDLPFRGASLASGQPWNTMESLYYSTNGYRKGVLLLDENFSSPARVYWGIPQGGLPSVNDMAGGRVSGSLRLLLPPYGLSV